MDLGGDNIYSTLHSSIMSSIDPDKEPTLFIIVYNHNEYTSATHWDQLGTWIESILKHTRVNLNTPLQLKLIGIQSTVTAYETEAENEFKLNTILNNCGQTIQEHREKLANEKQRLLVCLTETTDPVDKTRLTNSVARLDVLLKRGVYLNGDILIYEPSFQKEKLAEIVLDLEKITIGFGNTMPLDLNLKLKKHLVKLKKKTITLGDLTKSISSNKSLNGLLNSHPGLSIEAIIDYAKTVGEIFWMKFDTRLDDTIFLQCDYIFNTFKMIIRHDLGQLLLFNDNTVFKAILLYATESEFRNATSLATKYGYFENNLISGLCFISNVFDRENIEEDLNLLQEFSLVYLSRLDDEKGNQFLI